MALCTELQELRKDLHLVVSRVDLQDQVLMVLLGRMVGLEAPPRPDLVLQALAQVLQRVNSHQDTWRVQKI